MGIVLLILVCGRESELHSEIHLERGGKVW